MVRPAGREGAALAAGARARSCRCRSRRRWREGAPAPGIPYPWSVYRWLDGDLARDAPIADLPRFASDLAGFLRALRPRRRDRRARRPASTTSTAAARSRTYDARDAATRSTRSAPRSRATRSSASGRTRCARRGTATAGLVPRRRRGRQPARPRRPARAVLDFGSSGVGDPACDIVIAWTLPRPARPATAFRAGARRRRRHLVARPRLGAVEGADHARRLPRARARRARRCRGATSARCWPTTTRTGDSENHRPRMRWRRRELNPRPQSRQRWCLRA